MAASTVIMLGVRQVPVKDCIGVSRPGSTIAVDGRRSSRLGAGKGCLMDAGEKY